MKSWKTTLGGILAAAAVGMRKAPQTAGYADVVEMLGLALLGLAARDNNVTSEQAGAAPTPSLATKLNGWLLVGLVGTSGLVFGCVNKAVVSTDAQGHVVTNFVKSVDAERVGRLAGNAAQLGTQWAVVAHPEVRPALEEAVAGLQVLSDGKNYDPAAFQAVMTKLPLKTLQGTNGAIYISVGVMVWDEAVQAAEPLLKKELVQAVLPRVLRGMRIGLGMPGADVRFLERSYVSFPLTPALSLGEREERSAVMGGIDGPGRRFLTVQEERELHMLPEVLMPQVRVESRSKNQVQEQVVR